MNIINKLSSIIIDLNQLIVLTYNIFLYMFVGYLYLTNQYDNYKLFIIHTFVMYEIHSLLYSLIVNQTLISKGHHFFSIIMGFLICVYYKPSYDIFIYKIILFLCSNLPLVISHLNPHNIYLKMIWVVIFFICRIYLPLNTLYNILLGKYKLNLLDILDQSDYVQIIICVFCLGFWCLSLFWWGLIMKHFFDFMLSKQL